MKNKGLIAIIAVLALIIVGLVVYIVVGKNRDSKQTETTEVSTEAVTEKTEEKSDKTEKATKDDAEEKDKKDDKKSDDKKLACYATVSDGGNWQDGDKYVFQYNIDIHNDSKEDINDWKLEISGFKGGEIGDNWNGEYKISGDIMTVTAVDYNGTLAAKSTTNLGLQVKFDSSDAGSNEKVATVFADGEKYTQVKEEPTTASKKEKKVSKKEKKDAESGTPLEVHGKLSVDGTDIVDKNGDKYQLKGVSTHGIAWFPDYVNKDAFQTLRDDWDANLIRIAMYTAENGGYCEGGDQAELKSLVEDGVDYATELGMYVIIDWHILHDLNPQTHEDEAIAFFDDMSAKYADYDNVLYEICNEPNGGTTWSDVKAYAENVIPVIRANDKDAIIIVGTPTWSQDVDLAADDPITGEENIAYTTHFYAATHKENIRNKVKTAREKGLCVFISEFSICDASGNGGIDYDSAEEWFDYINENDISYAGWSLCNKDETSALISSSCDKTSGWTDDDLSDAGIWLKSQIQD